MSISRPRAEKSAQSETPAADFSKILEVFEVGMKFKKVMLKKGLRRARARCPKCPGRHYLHGTLNGPKNHFHMRCDGDCGMVMME